MRSLLATFLGLTGTNGAPSGHTPPMPAAAEPPEPPKSPARAPSVPTGGHERFLARVAKQPKLAPREATVRGFLEWYIDDVGSDDCELADLYEDYRTICELTNVERLPFKWFGKALDGFGCVREKVDYIVGNERIRPFMVRFPKQLGEIDRNAFPGGEIDKRAKKKRGRRRRSQVPWPDMHEAPVEFPRERVMRPIRARLSAMGAG